VIDADCLRAALRADHCYSLGLPRRLLALPKALEVAAKLTVTVRRSTRVPSSSGSNGVFIMRRNIIVRVRFPMATVCTGESSCICCTEDAPTCCAVIEHRDAISIVQFQDRTSVIRHVKKISADRHHEREKCRSLPRMDLKSSDVLKANEAERS